MLPNPQMSYTGVCRSWRWGEAGGPCIQLAGCSLRPQRNVQPADRAGMECYRHHCNLRCLPCPCPCPAPACTQWARPSAPLSSAWRACPSSTTTRRAAPPRCAALVCGAGVCPTVAGVLRCERERGGGAAHLLTRSLLPPPPPTPAGRGLHPRPHGLCRLLQGRRQDGRRV